MQVCLDVVLTVWMHGCNKGLRLNRENQWGTNIRASIKLKQHWLYLALACICLLKSNQITFCWTAFFCFQANLPRKGRKICESHQHTKMYISSSPSWVRLQGDPRLSDQRWRGLIHQEVKVSLEFLNILIVMYVLSCLISWSVFFFFFLLADILHSWICTLFMQFPPLSWHDEATKLKNASRK